MKSAFKILIFCLTLTGCQSDVDYNDITKRLEALENKRPVSELIDEKISEQKKEILALKLQLLRLSSKEEAISESNFTADGSHKNDPFLGPKDAEIVIMAFSDFQCRPCRQFFQVVFPKLKETFLDTNKVQFIFRDFPLETNTHAREAASLAHCAGEQGAYWKAHDALFSEIEAIDFGEFNKIIEKLSIDAEKLNKCLKSGRYNKEIDGDIKEGVNLGAKGAPGFFLGKRSGEDKYEGIFIRGAQPYAVLRDLIERIVD